MTVEDHDLAFPQTLPEIFEAAVMGKVSLWSPVHQGVPLGQGCGALGWPRPGGRLRAWGVEGEDSGCYVHFPARRCRSTGTQSAPHYRRRIWPKRSASKPKVGCELPSPTLGPWAAGLRQAVPALWPQVGAVTPQPAGRPLRVRWGFHEHRHVDVEQSIFAPEGAHRWCSHSFAAG